MSTVPTQTAAAWLGVPEVPAELTIRQVIDLVQARAIDMWPGRRITGSLAERRPGDDPSPDVDPDFGIIEVHRWRTIVDRVTDPEEQVALGDLPSAVRAHRKVGQPWYELVAHVLLAGANLEARPPHERGWGTRPTQKT